MYKINILLKIIIAILTITIVVITNNRIILWLLLFLLSFHNLKKNQKALLFIDLILVFLLGLSVEYEIVLYPLKLLFIINFIITFYKSLSLDDKKKLFRKQLSLKKMYYEDNFDKIVSRINEKKKEIYDQDVSIKQRVEEDLKRDYLQSRIRFLGVSSIRKKKFEWSTIDTLILLFSLILFLLFFILRY